MTNESGASGVRWVSPNPTHQEVMGVPDFWSRVAESRHSALYLDFDGTLAPFAEDRHHAYPLEGVPELVDCLASFSKLDLAIVSGRPVSEILRLLGRESIPIAGTHGFEYYHPASGTKVWNLSESKQKILDSAELIAKRIADEDRVERKVATVALHTRGLPVDLSAREIQAFESDIKKILPDHGFEIRRFDGGTELRAAGRDKGAALVDLITKAGDPDFVVYIGDDDTDEDAFRALPDFGVGIKVGSPGVATAAQGRLSNCEAVRQFLWTWTQIDKRS